MRPASSIIVFAALFTATFWTQTVRAAIILGNLAGSNDANAYPLYDTSQKAVAFTMGAQSYLLDAAVLRMNYDAGSPIVELRNDEGGANPGGTVLATFTTPAINGGGIQSYAFTPTSAVTLAANTKYWLNVFGGGDDFSQAAFWYRSNLDIEPAGGGAAWNDYRQSNDGGGSWTGSTTYNTFELQGTIAAVPEPSSMLLVGGVFAFGTLRRRLLPMTTLAPVDVGLVFAVNAEQGCFEDLLTGVIVHETPAGKFRSGTLQQHSVVTVVAGPGRAAARAAESLLVAHRPRLVVSAGYCGGLVANLKRNDIVVADRILRLDGTACVIEAATVARFNFADAQLGAFVEVDRIIAKSADKRAIGERTGASACEMESSAVAEVCAARQTPFLAVRVVSDAVDDDLPDDLAPLLDASTSTLRTIGAVVGTLWRRPSSVKDLMQLKESSLVAADRLAKFLAELTAQLPVSQTLSDSVER